MTNYTVFRHKDASFRPVLIEKVETCGTVPMNEMGGQTVSTILIHSVFFCLFSETKLVYGISYLKRVL